MWTTCLLFFQAALLAGYAWAHFLADRLSPRRQRDAHLALLGAALALLLWRAFAWPSPITPGEWAKPVVARRADRGDPRPCWPRPSACRSSCSPPRARCCRPGSHGCGPASRLSGSSRSRTAARWSGSRATRSSSSRFSPCGCRGGCGRWRSRSTRPASRGALSFRGATSRRATRNPPARRRIPRTPTRPDVLGVTVPPSSTSGWRFFPSVMLGAVTSHLTQEVAAVPFLWMVPLALYLLSFILCFSWPDAGRAGWRVALAVAAGLAVFGLHGELMMKVPPRIVMWCGVLFVYAHGGARRAGAPAAGAVRPHGLLPRDRGRRRARRPAERGGGAAAVHGLLGAAPGDPCGAAGGADRDGDCDCDCGFLVARRTGAPRNDEGDNATAADRGRAGDRGSGRGPALGRGAAGARPPARLPRLLRGPARRARGAGRAGRVREAAPRPDHPRPAALGALSPGGADGLLRPLERRGAGDPPPPEAPGEPADARRGDRPRRRDARGVEPSRRRVPLLRDRPRRGAPLRGLAPGVLVPARRPGRREREPGRRSPRARERGAAGLRRAGGGRLQQRLHTRAPPHARGLRRLPPPPGAGRRHRRARDEPLPGPEAGGPRGRGASSGSTPSTSRRSSRACCGRPTGCW